jgi:AraC-like DNA-binding protein
VQYHESRPPSILHESVKCFWTHEATYSADEVQEITPDGCVELIFNFGSPYQLWSTTPPTVLPPAIMVGFQKKTMPIRVDGTVRVVAARLFAWGGLEFLAEGLESDSIQTLGADWDALLGRLKAEVAAGRYEAATTALQEFLMQKALLRTYDVELVRTAARMLYQTKGQCRIDELAESCATSVRQLQRKFQRDVGASPKFFARTLRFEQAQRRLMLEPETELTGLAFDCGYFDQAHFIKEFRAFTGKTPSAYADQMRRLHDFLHGKDVVFLQS